MTRVFMPRLLIDVGLEDQRILYPKHGWAKNSQEQKVRLLWLPIIRLLYDTKLIRKTRTVVPLRASDIYNTSVRKDIRFLILALQELSSLLQSVETKGFNTNEGRSVQKLQELGPLYIDYSIMSIRRLVDEITFHARPILFGKYQNAPCKFKKMRELLNQQGLNGLHRYEVIAKEPRFILSAFQDQDSWFNSLSHPLGGNWGIRDTLEHEPGSGIDFSYTEEPDGQLKTFVSLHKPDQPSEHAGRVTFVHTDLINGLTEMIAGICDFCTKISLAVGSVEGKFHNEYWQGNCEFFVANNEDATRFWPEISAT